LPGAHCVAPSSTVDDTLMCDICMDDKPAAQFYALSCGGLCVNVVLCHSMQLCCAS
jgi:hypothetical protein